MGAGLKEGSGDVVFVDVLPMHPHKRTTEIIIAAAMTERKYFFIIEVYHHVVGPHCIESHQVSVVKTRINALANNKGNPIL